MTNILYRVGILSTIVPKNIATYSEMPKWVVAVSATCLSFSWGRRGSQ